jgi:hypothetical protein
MQDIYNYEFTNSYKNLLSWHKANVIAIDIILQYATLGTKRYAQLLVMKILTW